MEVVVNWHPSYNFSINSVVSHKSYFRAPFSKNLAFSPKKAYNSLGKPKRQGNNFGGQNNGLYYNFSRQKRIIRWLHHGRPQRRFGFGAFHGQKVRGRAAGGAPGRLSVSDLPCGGAAARPCAADAFVVRRGTPPKTKDPNPSLSRNGSDLSCLVQLRNQNPNHFPLLWIPLLFQKEWSVYPLYS